MSIYSDAVLILKPSGYKAAELYSVVPNTSVGDFDVARSSTTTRINASGYIEQVAANVPRLNYDSGDSCPYLSTQRASTNLITYPESFGNSYWTKSGATIEGSTTITGSELLPTNNGFEAGISTPPTGWTNLGNQVGSSVADGTAPEGSNVMEIVASGVGDNSANRIYANEGSLLTNGTYYRLQFYAKSISGNTTLSFQNMANTSETLTITGSWVEYTVYFMCSGAERGAYLHLGGAGTCRVDNFRLYACDGFSSPSIDYPLEAYKLVEDVSVGAEHNIASSNIAFTSGTTYTASVYVKPNGRTWFSIESDNITNFSAKVYFDISNGIVGTETFGLGHITPMANGWYRCSVVGLSGGTGNAKIELKPCEADNDKIYDGDGTSGAYIAFAQLEESNYASSLMLPATEGSTTSRVADAVTNAGNQSLFNSESGVLFLNIAALVDEGLTTDKWIALSDGTSSSSLRIAFSGGANTIRAYLNVGGAAQSDMTFTIADVTEFSKVGFRYAVDDFSLWVNGVERATDTSGSVFSANTLNELAFNNGGGGTGFYGKTNAIGVFDYLSDAEMVTLTT